MHHIRLFSAKYILSLNFQKSSEIMEFNYSVNNFQNNCYEIEINSANSINVCI